VAGGVAFVGETMADLAVIEKQETAKAAQAFADYVAMGPNRSLRKLAAAQGKGRSFVVQLERWSVDHSWQDRLKAIAAAQIAEAAELRTETYVTIAREYHRRFADPAMVKVAHLDSLNSVYDRVKPNDSEQAAMPTVIIHIHGVDTERI
jgi:hypothetical protein